jgi:hypothetical protein
LPFFQIAQKEERRFGKPSYDKSHQTELSTEFTV